MTSASKSRCVFTGSTRNVEANHPGGQNHAPEFTIPAERKYNVKHLDMQRAAGVDLRFTANTKLRLINAAQSCLLFLWMLLDELKKVIQSEVRGKR